MSRQQISTTVSDTTRQKAEWLMDNAGYSLRDIVTVGVDRVYQEARNIMEENTLGRIKHVEYNFSNLFTAGDWGGVDEEASEDLFADHLQDRLWHYLNDDLPADYPEITVEVYSAPREHDDKIRVWDRADNRIDLEYEPAVVEFLKDEAGKAFQDFEKWVVKSDDFPAPETA